MRPQQTYCKAKQLLLAVTFQLEGNNYPIVAAGSGNQARFVDESNFVLELASCCQQGTSLQQRSSIASLHHVYSNKTRKITLKKLTKALITSCSTWVKT
jgi:hypothetical protein